LAEHLVAAICERFGIRRKAISPPALEMLARYDWARNNVRELRNVVERMVIDSDGDVIGAEHVPPELVGSAPDESGRGEPRTFVERKAEAERQIVVAALERNEWHITRTAQELGLADHASLLKIMRRHGVSRQ
jgi:DNA-binding NtrC family response regulator